MIKRLTLALSLVLLVSLTACGKKPNIKDTPIQERLQQLSLEKAMEYSKALGDAAVAYYLEREYNTAYSLPLLGVNKLASINKQIVLETNAATHLMYYLQTAVSYSISLPGSPYYSEYNTVDTLDSSVIAQLDKYIFTDGKAPTITPMDVDMRVDFEFITWFIDKAKTSGLLDKRLIFSMSDTTLTVNSQDCGPTRGGLTFEVFGNTYTVSAADVGVTVDEVETSPMYDVVLKSYIYYDSGIYEAVYDTDATSVTSNTVGITVKFQHLNEYDMGYETELDRFLASIYGLTISSNTH